MKGFVKRPSACFISERPRPCAAACATKLQIGRAYKPYLQRQVAARAVDQGSELLQSRREPEDVRGAIAVGLELYEDQKYKEALDVFEKALKLPGTGAKRYRHVLYCSVS